MWYRLKARENSKKPIYTPPSKIGLVIAITLFILLDLGTLAVGYQISKQVEKDAVAINLAGRQRMLSQKITKAALIASDARASSAQQRAATQEAAQAYTLFLSTLQAFSRGGSAQGGAGEHVTLDQVQDQAATLVNSTIDIMSPWPKIPSERAELIAFSEFMIDHNSDILNAMNALTTTLETQSIETVSKLRIAQSIAFVLSLFNFFCILRQMHHQQHLAEISAITDPLTRLLNRAGIYQKLDEAILKSKASDTLTGLMLLDLNGFKRINDQFGHAEGDVVLIEASRRLMQWCRQANWQAGRLGGDEFVVICPDVTQETMQQSAAKLTSELSDITVTAHTATVSASVGWAIGHHEKSADTLISEADTMMYIEKAAHYASS